MQYLRPTCFTLGTLFGSACGGGDDPPTDAPPSDAPISASCQEAKNHSDLAWIQDEIFTKTCTFSACHDATQPAATLNLTAGMSRQELVGQAAVEPGVTSMLVVAGMPAQSYLLSAMGGPEPGTPPSDGVMPLAAPQLCKEKIDAVRRWIQAGAN